jgi:pyruvate,water dikinase
MGPEIVRDRRLVRDATELYRRILVWHGAGTMLTQGLYDQLGRLCAAAGMEGRESELVGGLEDVEEGAVVSDLWALSRGRLDRATVLARHGFHGPEEGELSATVWRERPDLIDPIINAFARMDDDDAPERKRARSAADAAAATARVAAGSGAVGRARARPLIALTRMLMPLREVGRGGLVRVLDGARAAARRLGDQAVETGVLQERDDVFFLTIDELTGASGPPRNARELVADRRERHSKYLTTRLPDGWRGNPEPRPAGDEAGDASELAGAAASAGHAEGIARVVTSPEHGDDLAPGEILVCHTTDPGWASLMHISAALVIDVGGPLSHGAIVARELGVPCVIGTHHGTSTIRTGDRLSVDGTHGRVQILEREMSTR